MDKKSEGSASKNGTILYGVPRVEFGAAGITPFPMCLKASANYLGQEVSYDSILAGCGAAFRLTWDTTAWNGGNVDVIFTFDDAVKVYQLGVEMLGREFKLLGRTSKLTVSDPAKFAGVRMNGDKADFQAFIKSEIDKGMPCIALGVVGPPEACILTGYRENGEVLLGWNFFQDSPEFAADLQFDESGYFISRHWWENADTVAVISLGHKTGNPITDKEIVANAIEVMEGRLCGNYAKGLLAYDAWKKAVTDPAQFPDNAILPILAERLMCQGDAMDCLAEGRHNAALFMRSLAERNPEVKTLCKSAEEQFLKVEACVWQMAQALGGYERNEPQMRNFAKKEVREKISRFIDEAKEADGKAWGALNKLYLAM
ncbi:RNA polymerase subunit sigma-24 [Paenibacillus phocaensis]|uniref:RNA polymerase subunit sigma-24 n=1 Tax=Paenibacillus phocaensis TaxID=1776378 RepID=UPI000839B4E9|nr:RNA polymerase subunit sigma-24 [Paenibacillus phocaensis]